MVAIIAIYRLNLKYPNAKIIVIVPSIKLHQDWINAVEDFRLKNVDVYVVNTYVDKYLTAQAKAGSKDARWVCDLLVCDEVHNYLSEEGTMFNKTIGCTNYKMFLGLSATLNEEEKKILERINISIVDVVNLSEARKFNYISDYKIYNLGIELRGEDFDNYNRLNDIHNSNFGKFFHFDKSEQNYELARACSAGNDVSMKVGNEWKTGKEWRKWYAKIQEWDGDNEHTWSPKNITKYANQWNWAMRERKNFLYNHGAKIDVAKELIELLNAKVITFAENTSFADNLAYAIGNKARAYHSNLTPGFEKEKVIIYRKQLTAAKRQAMQYNGKIGNYDEDKGYPITYFKENKISPVRLRKLALSKFENDEISVLCTAKALDEGFNVEGIDCAIICSASSKRRQNIQRIGRCLRYIEGKTAKIINIYIKDTQDENWLRLRQKGDVGVIWTDNIRDILN